MNKDTVEPQIRGRIIPQADGLPLASIIIAVYNDEANLGSAIRSVLDQTLRSVEVIVVDDCSTDGSFAVAESLASIDSRVRCVRLSENTGGAGAPRNIGIAAARGRYVGFVDSDDQLERHACANMVRVGDRDGSDLIMGKTRRVDVAKGTYFGWHAALFDTERTVASIEDAPDLAMDTSVAKMCRLTFLNEHHIRYPEDIHYEDLVFAADLMRLSSCISVIPEITYFWNVYPESVRKSITHQRDSLSNVESRIEALNRILELVDAETWPLMREQLLEKIVVHDARLYMNDIADSNDDLYAKNVLALLSPLLAKVPSEIFARLEVQRRLGAAAVIAEDPSLVRKAVGMLRRQADVRGSVQIDQGNAVWEGEATLESASLRARELASFDASELRDVAWFGMKFLHELTSMKRLRGGRIQLRGKTADAFGHLEDVPHLIWKIRVYERDGLNRSWSFPVQLSERDDETISWVGELALPADVDFKMLPRMTIRMDLLSDSVRNTSGIQVNKKFKWANYKIPALSPWSRLFGAKYQPYSTVQKTLALKPSAVQSKRQLVRRVCSPIFLLKRKIIALSCEPIKNHKSLSVRFAYIVMRLMPLDKKSVLIDSHMGTSDWDSPGVIGSELRRTFDSLKVTTAASATSPVWASGRLDTVRIGTFAHLWSLATTGFLVDNQSLPWYYVKRKGQVYVQTWHGIPLKRMGLDQADLAQDSKASSNLVKRARYWDYLSIPSEYFLRVFVPAFAATARQLPIGSPRNDALVSATDLDRSVAKRQLGLDASKISVLYAPTFRDGQRGAVQLALDLDEWVQSMGGEFQLLVRSHYLNRIHVPRHLRRFVVDVSDVKDTSMVLQAVDMLVTDYSSIMFDFLATGRPQILFTYDLSEYMNDTRGTYFDLRETAPGPLAFDQENLHELIRSASVDDSYARQRAVFRDLYAGREPGNAAQSTIQEVWSNVE